MPGTSVAVPNTAAAAELKLINNVELKLALSNDTQFEKLLSIYLGPILLKLESPHRANREKTLSVLSMIDNRLEGGAIRIPSEALLKQYHDPKISIACKDTVVEYLNKALKQVKNDPMILPQLMRGFSQASSTQQSIIFSMICRILRNFEASSNITKKDELLSQYQIDSTADAAALAGRFLDLMLLNLGHFAERRQRPRRSISSSDHIGQVVEERPSLGSSQLSAMSGLTEEDIRFLTPDGPSTFTLASLNESKAGLLRYVDLPVMESSSRFVIALVGSLDLKNELQTLGDSLYRLLLRLPQIEHRLQVKIYQLLSKSSTAVDDLDNALRAITLGVESDKPRVRSAAIGFLQWFARFAPVADTRETTHRLLSQLSLFLADKEVSDEAKSSAYLAIGLLCKKDAKFAQQNVEIVRTLFAALSTEVALRPAVGEALSNLMYVYKNASSETLMDLKVVLLDTIINKPAHTHYTALRFCLATYPFSDAGARWICILAMGKSSTLEATQEARRGLNLYQFQMLQQSSAGTAHFPALAELIHWPMQNLVNGAYLNFSTIQELEFDVLDALVRFSRLTLYANVLRSVDNNNVVNEEAFEQNLYDVVIHDLHTRTRISQFLALGNVEGEQRIEQSLLEQIHRMLRDTFLRHASVAAGTGLLELLILYPEPFSTSMIADLPQIRLMVDSQSEDLRKLAKRIYAIVVTTEEHPDAEVVKQLHDLVLTSGAKDSAGLRAASLLCRILLALELRGRHLEIDLRDLDTSLLASLQSKNSTLIKISLEAIGDLALTRKMAARSDYVSSLLQLMQSKAKQVEASVTEQATLVLGYISSGLQASSQASGQIVEFLLGGNVDLLQIDQLLASGEALACCIGCWQSSALQGSIDVPSLYSDTLADPSRGHLASELVDRLLISTKSPRPSERKGACIRLISLVQLLALPEINNKFFSIHQAFLGLLSDKDDFIVESANKGIQVVYEKSDQKQKDILVAQLFSTMTSDSAAKQAGNVSGLNADTELFLPGTITVGAGEQETSLSTYKDICNLAIDAGNNSLIYSFLSLASSSSMWSTRRGAALGLNSLLSTGAGSSIAAKSPDMLRRLLPKLYRYKHDPSTKVSDAMKGIFQQLFPNSKEALDKDFPNVLKDLLKCLNDSQWRVRESAASALTNLISGRSTAQFQDQLEELWTLAFRVLDDVKESVRAAAVGLCRSLANIALKSAENYRSHQGSSETILETAIPLFLKYLKSTSIEVSSFSLDTLLKITKTAGRSVRPHLPVLIEEFLVLTTTMEPEVMNYLGFHASKYNLSQADLDGHRLASMRTSPLIEALEQCIDQLDEESGDVALPRVCHIIRQTNGLPTRAAISRFLISLTARNPTLMKRYADNVLQALSATLQDRNETVVSLSASSIGYLARVASDEKLTKLINFLSKKQFESDDQNNAQGLVLKAISQNANDRFNSLGDVFLPLCFFAMHDMDEKASLNYKQAWENNTGSIGAVKLYLKEILALIEKHLASPIWRVKQMSAKSLADIATSIDLGNNLQRVLALVVDALNGKSWNGKESVLQAFVALLKRSLKTLTGSQMAEYRSLIRREVKRTNVTYKRHALVHYATFLDLDAEYDSFSEVQAIVEDILKGDSPDLEEEDDEENGRPMKLLLKQNAMKCLLTAYRPSIDPDRAMHYRGLLKYASSLSATEPWNIKTQLCSDLGNVFDRMKECTTRFWPEDLVIDTWTLLMSLMQDRSYASLREAAARTTIKFAETCRSQNVMEDGDPACLRMRAELERMIHQEQSTIVQGVFRLIKF